MNIKPGSLCRIVCNCQPEHRDRIVTARHRTEFFGQVCWYVTAGWLTMAVPMQPKCLRPIHDPDQSITETTEEEIAA